LYTLRVLTVDGCDTTVSVYIPEEQHFASFEVDTIVCQGSPVAFNNTSDSHFTAFAWSFGDGDVSAQQSPVHTYPGIGYYTARLIATGPICIDTVVHRITVDSIQNSYFRLEPDRICMGQTIFFYPDIDSTVHALHWRYGDGSSMTSAPEALLQHAYDQDGEMVVNLTTEYRACPASSFTDTIQVYPLPKIYLGPDSGLCLDGAPIVLLNEWDDAGTPTKYLWNTGDTSASLKVVHPGSYSLTISKGPLDCSATESVVIHKQCYVVIPNAFTPNGDGENDYFFPRQLLSRNITRFDMRILNRWGQEVFATTRTDGRGWDGRLNDKPQQQGVYIYRISLTIDHKREEEYAGNVTLIR
ncbi:MAG: PKD domain-containing protein, partial [Sphingobacteriales bacterium]